MLRQRLIPSLLLRRSRLVKGVRFAGHRDAGAAATTAQAHNHQGADELVLLDIDATRENRDPDFPALEALAGVCRMPLTFGGGVRTLELARRAIAGGADKVIVTAPARREPALLTAIAHRFGAQAVVLGVDVVRQDGKWRLYDHVSGTVDCNADLVDWIREGVERGAGEVRLTAVDREGTRQGLDLDLLAAVRAVVSTPILLEGGAGSLIDVAAGFRAGADGVCLGTMLVFSDNNIVKIKRYLEAERCNIRV